MIGDEFAGVPSMKPVMSGMAVIYDSIDGGSRKPIGHV
jgi:hypothetical protein